MARKKNIFVTLSSFWRIEEKIHNKDLFYKFMHIINTNILSRFGYRLKNIHCLKVEQNSSLMNGLLKLRKDELSFFLSNYFTDIGLTINQDLVKMHIDNSSLTSFLISKNNTMYSKQSI